MERYAWQMRLIHWLLAGLVLLQLSLIFCFGQLQSLAFGQFALSWHRTVGFLIIVVIAARFLVGVFIRAPAPIAGAAKWQRAVAKLAHWGILGLLAAQVGAGLILAGARGDLVSVVGLFNLAPLVPYDADAADRLLSVHRVIGEGLVGLLLLHIGAVGFHRLVEKRDILPRMFVAPDLGRFLVRVPIWSQIVTVCLVLLCLTFGIGFYAVARTNQAGRLSADAFDEIVTVGGHIRAGRKAFEAARSSQVRHGDEAATAAFLERARSEFAAVRPAARDPDVRDTALTTAQAIYNLERRLPSGPGEAMLKTVDDQIELLVQTEDAATVRAKVASEQAGADAHDLILLSILPALIVVLALAATLSGNMFGWVNRVRRQAAATAEQAKTDFLANLSHEIRTPLNGVLGLVDALGGTTLTPAQHELAQTIANSAGALNSILVDVLEFSRLGAGDLEIAEKPFQLDDVIAECAALFEPAAREKGLGLKVELAEETHRRVIGDPARLRQVLTNLLSNALKFTRAGEISVLATIVSTDCFQILVRDTGIGFKSADAERIFERFEQADGSATREFGGTGLGLAICRQLVGLMGGSLSATSALGQGSTFSLVLPLPAATDLVAEAAVSSGVADSGEAPALRVLVVDDNATNRQVVQLILQAVGVEVVCAENGLEGVQAVVRDRFDVVLMDLQMPVMDGLSAIRAIRARETAQKLARIPVIVISANTMPEQVAASGAAGADDHLGKPIRADVLIEAIAGVLEPDGAAEVEVELA